MPSSTRTLTKASSLDISTHVMRVSMRNSMSVSGSKQCFADPSSTPRMMAVWSDSLSSSLRRGAYCGADAVAGVLRMLAGAISKLLRLSGQLRTFIDIVDTKYQYILYHIFFLKSNFYTKKSVYRGVDGIVWSIECLPSSQGSIHKIPQEKKVFSRKNTSCGFLFK